MKQRDICLVPFPFSDLSGTKVRPVLVVSNDLFNSKSSDVIVSAITSNSSSNFEKIDSSLLDEGSLHKLCFVKHESLFRLDKGLLLKRIGVLKNSSFNKIKKKIINLF